MYKLDNLFELNIQRPEDTIALYNSVGIKIPFEHPDSLYWKEAPLVSSFRVMDLCGNSFISTFQDSTNQPYNTFTDFEIEDVQSGNGFILVQYVVTGNFKAFVDLSESSELITGDYKILLSIINESIINAT